MSYAMTASLAISLIASVAAAENTGDLTPPKPKLEAIAWMAGAWHGEGLGGQIEEHWAAASGGTMMGAFRLVADQKMRVIEFLIITQEPERVIYRFKHFRADFSTWEKEAPLEFTLIRASSDEAVFHSEVPDQNSPRRLTYRLIGGDSLSVVVEGSDTDGKLDDSFEVRFTRR